MLSDQLSKTSYGAFTYFAIIISFIGKMHSYFKCSTVRTECVELYVPSITITKKN